MFEPIFVVMDSTSIFVVVALLGISGKHHFSAFSACLECCRATCDCVTPAGTTAGELSDTAPSHVAAQVNGACASMGITKHSQNRCKADWCMTRFGGTSLHGLPLCGFTRLFVYAINGQIGIHILTYPCTTICSHSYLHNITHRNYYFVFLD